MAQGPSRRPSRLGGFDLPSNGWSVVPREAVEAISHAGHDRARGQQNNIQQVELEELHYVTPRKFAFSPAWPVMVITILINMVNDV
jgi:hypothetical protein